MVEGNGTLPIWFLGPGFFVTATCVTVYLCIHAFSSCIVFMDLNGSVGSLLQQEGFSLTPVGSFIVACGLRCSRHVGS